MSRRREPRPKGAICRTIFSETLLVCSFGEVHCSRDAARNREPFDSSFGGLTEDVR